MKNKKYRSGEFSLTEGQVEKLLQNVTGLSELCLLKLALSVGVRRLDIVNIKSADVDLEKSTVTFYQHKKKNTITRPVPITVMQSLEMWLNINKSSWLFPGVYNSKVHMSDRHAYNVLQKCLERAGLPKRPFHALRATCTKLCQKNGWTPEQTAWLIDDSVKTVQEHYTTPSDEEMKEVVKEKGIL